jgi:hypothetical protein
MPLKNPLLFAAAGNNMELLNQINLHQEDTPPVVHGFIGGADSLARYSARCTLATPHVGMHGRTSHDDDVSTIR